MATKNVDPIDPSLSCASSAEAQLLFLAQHEVEHKQHKGNE
jgi:hypothetical protein